MQTCLERPLPWETICLGRLQILSERLTIQCNWSAPVLWDPISMANGRGLSRQVLLLHFSMLILWKPGVNTTCDSTPGGLISRVVLIQWWSYIILKQNTIYNIYLLFIFYSNRKWSILGWSYFLRQFKVCFRCISFWDLLLQYWFSGFCGFLGGM